MKKRGIEVWLKIKLVESLPFNFQLFIILKNQLTIDAQGIMLDQQVFSINHHNFVFASSSKSSFYNKYYVLIKFWATNPFVCTSI